jgi:mRNA-degrading endonuclease RelE of RelBE toxin-antitoxin system
MFQHDFAPLAQDNLDRIVQRNPELAEKIIRKIEWLAANAERVAHQRVKDSPYFSLHSGSYRVIYALDATQRRILILGVGQHDAAYRRINRLQ